MLNRIFAFMILLSSCSPTTEDIEDINNPQQSESSDNERSHLKQDDSLSGCDKFTIEKYDTPTGIQYIKVPVVCVVESKDLSDPVVKKHVDNVFSKRVMILVNGN